MHDEVRIPTPAADAPVGPPPAEGPPDLDAVVDCAVVGAGPAGLQAALCLARYRRSVAVFDTGEGRSTFGQINHNLLGHPGGIPAQELRRLGMVQLADYDNVTLIDACVDGLEAPAAVPVDPAIVPDRSASDPDPDPDAEEATFRLTTSEGRFRARTVLVATGVRDHFPRFDGWELCVGRSMYWCLACDAYEHCGGRVVVLGNGDAAAGEALQLRRYADEVAVVTGSGSCAIGERAAARLERAGIEVVIGAIARADHDEGQLSCLHLTDGRQLPLEGLFVAQGATPNAELAAGLGAACTDAGWIVVDDEQRTSVPGLFAAGDVTAHHSHQISTALHEGTQAAAAVNYALYPPALRLSPSPPTT